MRISSGSRVSSTAALGSLPFHRNSSLNVQIGDISQNSQIYTAHNERFFLCKILFKERFGIDPKGDGVNR